MEEQKKEVLEMHTPHTYFSISVYCLVGKLLGMSAPTFRTQEYIPMWPD